MKHAFHLRQFSGRERGCAHYVLFETLLLMWKVPTNLSPFSIVFCFGWCVLSCDSFLRDQIHRTHMVQITLSRSTHARCVRFKSPLLSGCGTSSSTSSIYLPSGARGRAAAGCRHKFFTPLTKPPTNRACQRFWLALSTPIYTVCIIQADPGAPRKDR